MINVLVYKDTDPHKKDAYPLKIVDGRRETGISMERKNLEMTKEPIMNFTAKTIIRRWGNSQGIRLSKEILAQMNLKEDDTVGISIYDGKMTIEKINRPKYLNLQERLESFYNKPLDEIYIESTPEVEVGDPKGNEIW